MELVTTKIPGAFIVETDTFKDDRGSFVKTFHEDTFKKYTIETDFKESFYSISKKDVIRGMHFHLPPQDHAKLVYVTHGATIDVILDLRKGSPTYGEYQSIELSAENHRMVYIPRGCAHGFISLVDDTCMVYLQSGVYSKECDAGIAYNSFGMEWPTQNPILSTRDQEFVTLKDFETPFTYTHETTY